MDVHFYVGDYTPWGGGAGSDANNGTSSATPKANYSALTTGAGAGNRAIINIAATHAGDGLTSIGSVSATKNSLTMTASAGLGLQANDIIVYGKWWGRVSTYSGTTLVLATGFNFPYPTGSYDMSYIRPVIETRSVAQLTFNAALQSVTPFKTEIRFGCTGGNASSAAYTGTTAFTSPTIGSAFTCSAINCDIVGRLFFDNVTGIGGIICKSDAKISAFFSRSLSQKTTPIKGGVYFDCVLVNGYLEANIRQDRLYIINCGILQSTQTLGLIQSAQNLLTNAVMTNTFFKDCDLFFATYLSAVTAIDNIIFENCRFYQTTGTAVPRSRHTGTVIFRDNNGLSAKLSDEGASFQGGETRYLSAVTFAPDTVDFIGIGTMAKLPSSDSNFTLLNSVPCSQVFFNIAFCYFNGRTVGQVTTQGTLLNQPVKTWFDAGSYLIRVRVNHYIPNLTGYNFHIQQVCDCETLLGESGTDVIPVRSGNGDWSVIVQSGFTIATAQNIELRVFGSWYDPANRLAFGYAEYSPDGGVTWIAFKQTWIDGKIAFPMAQQTTTADKILAPVKVTVDGQIVTGTLSAEGGTRFGTRNIRAF